MIPSKSLAEFTILTALPFALRYLGVPTDKAYETFAKQKKISPQNVSLNHGAKGHWIGNKDAKKVIVYYHGRRVFSCMNILFLIQLSSTRIAD